MHTPDLVAAVEAALLDRDGSARDLNFEKPTWSGLWTLLERLRFEFAHASVGATSADTDEMQVAEVTSAISGVERHGGSVQILFADGSGLMSHLQLFVSSDAASAPFIEMTFFPDDLNETLELGGTFIAWVCQLRTVLDAVRVYARYENASWEFGSVGPGSGVFFVSNE